VRTLKRDYVQVTPLPNAEVVLGLLPAWFEDYNTHHPHSGLKMRSPRVHRSSNRNRLGVRSNGGQITIRMRAPVLMLALRVAQTA
jgi:transposase InsO family protein